MKKNRNLLKNIAYTWKRTLTINGKAQLICIIIFILLSSVIPFITTALPSFAVWLLTNDVFFGKTIFFVAIYSTVLIFLNLCIRKIEIANALYVFKQRIDAGFNLDKKILTTDFENIDSQKCKDKIQQATAAVYWNDDIGFPALLNGSRDLIINVLCLIIYSFVAVNLNLFITFILIVTPLVDIYANSLNIKWIEKNKSEWAKHDKKIQYLKTQSLDLKNGKDIRLYRFQNWFVDLFYNVVDARIYWYNKSYRKTFTVQLVSRIVFVLQSAFIYGYLLYSVLNGMEISLFILYLGSVTGIGEFIKKAYKQLTYMQTNNVYVNDYLNYVNIQDKSNRGQGRDIPKDLAHELKFENISYSYPDSEHLIFDNLNLTIKKGEKIALVGANGAGKTTFIKLLCGLYIPSKGNIYLDGINIQEFNINTYFNEFSLVFQDVFAFAYSIAQNVACTDNDDIDYEKLNLCLELSGLKEKVNLLPKREHTTLLKELDSEGIVLSGGEMQKLMLARALYKNGSIIILDEPTAALDPIAESEMYEKYNSLIAGKTSIFISHRLSSTRFCDRILFMKDGKIVEEGTHEQLLKLNGDYAKMYEIQSHYYQKEVQLNDI